MTDRLTGMEMVTCAQLNPRRTAIDIKQESANYSAFKIFFRASLFYQNLDVKFFFIFINFEKVIRKFKLLRHSSEN